MMNAEDFVDNKNICRYCMEIPYISANISENILK